MIGIFDSGVGGLTVVRALMDKLPGYNMIYFGDTARTPYGTKSRETVINYAVENTEFLLDKGAGIIVMACNSASSVATEKLREKFELPVFEVITPAVELSINISEGCRIGVIGTRATINSGIYEKKILEINSRAKVFSASCPLMVPLVEEGWFDKPETTMIVKKYLHPLKTRQIDALILGCTHFPILKNIIQRKIGKRVYLVDSSIAIAEKIKSFLADNPDVDERMIKTGSARFMVSDRTDRFEKSARMILKRRIRLEHADL